MKTIIFILAIITLNGCRDKYEGQPLAIQNNSNQRIYFFENGWETYDFPSYHFPDTILPIQKPVYLNSIESNNSMNISEVDPNYNAIFDQLPAGKYSIYFFAFPIETQQDWDNIRNNNLFIRKDVTLQELKENDYIIVYP